MKHLLARYVYNNGTRNGEKVSNIPSLVINEMNSLTHSCMHSLASFAILAFSGNAVFMIRATGAKFRISASASTLGGDVGLAYCKGDDKIGEFDLGQVGII